MQPFALDLASVLAFFVGAIMALLTSSTAGAWFLSGRNAIISEHARRLIALEAELRAHLQTSADIDTRLARIETTLDFIAKGLHVTPQARRDAHPGVSD